MAEQCRAMRSADAGGGHTHLLPQLVLYGRLWPREDSPATDLMRVRVRVRTPLFYDVHAIFKTGGPKTSPSIHDQSFSKTNNPRNCLSFAKESRNT